MAFRSVCTISRLYAEPFCIIIFSKTNTGSSALTPYISISLISLSSSFRAWVEETFEFKYKKSNAFDSGDTEFIAIIVGEYKGEKAKEEGRKYFCCEYSFMDYKDKDKGDYDNFSPQSFNEKSYIKDAVDSVIEYNKDREKQLKKNGDI